MQRGRRSSFVSVSFAVAYRDETDTLRARIESLESDLARSDAKVARLVGSDDYAKPGILPKKRWNFVRQLRVFRGDASADVYERVAQHLRSEGPSEMQVGMVGRILTGKSNLMVVTLMPGEDDELLLVVDHVPRAIVLGLTLLVSATISSVQSSTLLGMLGGTAFITAAIFMFRWFDSKVGSSPKRLFGSVVHLIDSTLTSQRVRIDAAEEPEVEELRNVDSHRAGGEA